MALASVCTACGGQHCCQNVADCQGGDHAWHFWNGSTNKFVGPCLGCSGDTNGSYWDGTSTGSYARLTVCEKL